MIISKFGISYDRGKGFMTWVQYLEVLRIFANDKIINDIMVKMKNITEYSAMEFGQLQDMETVNRIAIAIGVKPTKTLDGTKARIIKQLSSKNSDTDIDTNCRI